MKVRNSSPKVDRFVTLRFKWIIVCIALTFSMRLTANAQRFVDSAPRADITLNGMWDYELNKNQDKIPTSGWNTRRIPEPPLADGTTSVWYRKTVNIPSSWASSGRSFFVELEKAGHYAAIYWNGRFIGDHYGQYEPFEVDVTSAVRAGRDNEIEIYTHQADSYYARAGVVLNQGTCPPRNPNCMANAYRPAADDVVQRNWVGIVGDITFSWRPTERISDVGVVSSVRNSMLQAYVNASGAHSGVTEARATVLDGKNPVLTLPTQKIQNGKALLQASWNNPVLWGPPPYGQPKLYSLRTELIENGNTIDVIYTRFGFREVWVQGKDVFLNGQKLWMAGTYPRKLAPIRYVNDRRPQAFMLYVMESSGMNTLQTHWDDPGRNWLELADEMGILVVGSFFCDGRPQIQSKADDVNAWLNWMADTTAQWVQARKNHPSIVMWRPGDVSPLNVPRDQMWTTLAPVVRQADPSGRPVADHFSEVDAWSQSWQNANNPNQCDDGSNFTKKLANDKKPLLTKELYGDYSLPCVPSYFDMFYRLDDQGGGVGLIVQHTKLFEQQNFTPDWFSISGRGNRVSSPDWLPNWISRHWAPTNWSSQFAGLYETYVEPTLPQSSPTRGEYQASGLPNAQAAFLVSSDGTANPIGVVIAQDGSGTAWFDVPEPGAYKLVYRYGSQDYAQDVTVNAPPPFGQAR